MFDQILTELAHVVADHVNPLDACQDRLGVTAEEALALAIQIARHLGVTVRTAQKWGACASYRRLLWNRLTTNPSASPSRSIMRT